MGCCGQAICLVLNFIACVVVASLGAVTGGMATCMFYDRLLVDSQVHRIMTSVLGLPLPSVACTAMLVVVPPVLTGLYAKRDGPRSRWWRSLSAAWVGGLLLGFFAYPLPELGDKYAAGVDVRHVVDQRQVEQAQAAAAAAAAAAEGGAKEGEL
eukprot:gnl/TRDRNA2_/TRDRNA2_189155_c0_seq1.p2 gnl/TRDRNA2_/TRDRNA2_189155_c0~~gnl/TRDRNA2_/TRDRNA2_189155_c0_seq1.p2  ORF type:complete len:154 (-),score=24.06 gnl/TRDRNA2_/TRDRNA2_189155_c0_seq1:74-535(-)